MESIAHKFVSISFLMLLPQERNILRVSTSIYKRLLVQGRREGNAVNHYHVFYANVREGGDFRCFDIEYHFANIPYDLVSNADIP